MAEYDEPAPEGTAAADGAGRSSPAKRGSDGRSPQRDAQPHHRERSSKCRDRGRERDEHDEDRERSRRRGGDMDRYLDREIVRGRGDHHDRQHRERSERREHRDRSDDRGYRRSRDRDAERGDRDRDGHRRHRSRSRSKSQSKRVSGFDQGPSQAIPTAAPSVIPGPLPFIAPAMLPNMPNIPPNLFNLPNLGQPQPMTQQATRHARRVYVGGLSPSANEQTVAVFFNQVMAAIGGNTVGIGDAVVNVYINHDKKFAFVEMRSVEEASNAMALDGIVFDGAPVKVRRPTDYNPSQAAMLGPSQPNPNLNLAAVGLTPGLAGALEGPDRIFVGGLPYYFTEDQVRELLETFGPLRAFDIVKDKETGNSKGYAFCLYKDVSVTDIACAALNGIQLGERTLTVRRANQGSSEPRPEQENILLQAQQQAQMKVMKLAELHKESSEEWSKKAGELEGVIKALETHLTQVEDEYKEKLEKESLSRRDLEKEAVNLKQKLEKCELDLENTRKSSELSLIPLTSIAADSSDLVDTTIREPPISDAVNQNDLMVIPKVPSGVSGTALAASLLRDGWSLAKTYEKYQEATDAFLHEWRGRRHAEAVLERVLHEIEEKAELNLDERAEHERMVEAYALMDQILRQALLEHDNFENNIRNLKSELKRQESDYSVAQKEIDDLQKQVAVLLKECQDIQIRCGSSLPNVGHGAFPSSLGNVLSNVEHGIKDNMSFKDINGLVQQNVLLRNQVHMLKADLDKKDMELRESFQIELKKITDDAASRVEKVIKKSEEQAIMIESLPRSVAMYRKLCEEQQKAGSNVESAPNALQDSSRTDLMVLFEGSQEVSKKAYEQVSERARSLDDELTKLRKHDDEELELLLLSWIENSDFCSPIKKVEACLFDFDLLQQFRGDELYYLVELQINKNNNVRRTFGDHKLIYSKVEKGEVIKKTTYRFQERGGNVNGRKLVEFSKVGGPKDKVLWKIIFGEDKRKMRKAQSKSTQREEKEMLPQNVPTKEKVEKSKLDEKRKLGEQDMVRLMQEKENEENTIASLQQDILISRQMEEHLAMRLKEAEFLLMQSKKKVEEIESASQLQSQLWSRKANIFQSFMDNQKMSIKDIRISSQSIKQEMFALQMKWTDEISNIGHNLKGLVDAADNYHKVLAENQKLFNEVQELKGNIRVYCRVRPFLPGQDGKTTIIDCIGESGEILITNPFKQGKDACRMFKFNKVFDTHASQAEVFSNIQPLIRSVLDGFNVCIFAYGQTGSGKTYTMTGPGTSKEDRGVNYRALNDLFDISLSRRNAFSYEVGVQMVEIYNEQVRDLLSNDIAQKRLGISSTSQPNGLVVPDASLHPVKSTLDVLEWMEIGETNRAVGSTALNKESSRSHSILTVHVRGVDLKNQSTWRGCLHLIDLAGSERIVQSDASGDRLKEAKYINKSLSALGDVVSALAQRNAHVPYRNSKLTQLLRSSLGGQAKTLMFVQINPDTESYSETISTLKFAERVSGVELGAAISNKEVSYLKDTKSRKDVEIDELLKDKAKSSSSAIDRNDSSQQIRLSGAAGSGEAKCEDNMPDDGYLVAGTVSPVSPVGGASEATEQMQKTASRIATLFLTKNGQPANSKPKPWESALKPPGRTTSTGSQVTGVSSVKPPKWR